MRLPLVLRPGWIHLVCAPLSVGPLELPTDLFSLCCNHSLSKSLWSFLSFFVFLVHVHSMSMKRCSAIFTSIMFLTSSLEQCVLSDIWHVSFFWQNTCKLTIVMTAEEYLKNYDGYPCTWRCVEDVLKICGPLDRVISSALLSSFHLENISTITSPDLRSAEDREVIFRTSSAKTPALWLKISWRWATYPYIM